jgi:transcriptional regulator with XRE-family HTH domain
MKHPITKLIKSECELKGLTRAKLSDLTGYEENYLSTLVNGKTGFPLSFLVAISEALEMNLHTLLKLKND